MFKAIEKRLTQLSTALAVVGGLGLGFAILVTCVSTINKGLSRVFNSTFGANSIPDLLSWIKPISGEDELVAFAIGFALFAACPLLMIKQGHVKIDLLEGYFGARFNRLLDLIGNISFAVIAWLILTNQWFLIFKKARVSRGQDTFIELLISRDWANISKRFLDAKETQVLSLKYWPMHIWAEICVALFFVVACFCVVRSFRFLQSPIQPRT